MPLLSSILSNTQTPHQPFVLLLDSPAVCGVSLLADLVQRALDDDQPIAFISVLHPPETYGLSSRSNKTNVKVLDLTCSVPGYAGPSSVADQPNSMASISQWLLDAVHALGRRTQVFVDALDVLAEDYSSQAGARNMVRAVLKALSALKAPSRLQLLLPSSSPLIPHLILPSLSSTITTLTLYPSNLIDYLSSSYLLTPSPSTAPSSEWTPPQLRYYSILRGAGERNQAWHMALQGENGIEVSDWTAGPSQGDNGTSGGCVVEVLVRKAQGGAGKGMSRSLEGLQSQKGLAIQSVRWEELDELRDLARNLEADEVDAEPKDEAKHPSQEHIPFNLALTPAQQASRANVPVPYAHEGDEGHSTPTGGGGKIVFEPGSDDDMDDDDPDEDLDF